MPALERVRRLDDVVVHRNDRVLDLARQRIGQEKLGVAHSHLLGEADTVHVKCRSRKG